MTDKIKCYCSHLERGVHCAYCIEGQSWAPLCSCGAKLDVTEEGYHLKCKCDSLVGAIGATIEKLIGGSDEA